MYKFERTQFIKSDIGTVWDFMSSPKNLAIITPPHMNFTIVNGSKTFEEMYAGQIIEYNVSPALGIKLKWVTEITHVHNNNYFVDEQRFGPYTFWHHKHFIKEVKDGIEMVDIVHYIVPYGLIGRIINSLFLKHKLNEIFDYRFNKLNELFKREN